MTVVTRHYCRDCEKFTEHEREATVPEQYRCGDPDYEDRTKCGECGEHYACDECGAPWDVETEQCEAVRDYGGHGHDLGQAGDG
jgi:hypothetical protein